MTYKSNCRKQKLEFWLLFIPTLLLLIFPVWSVWRARLCSWTLLESNEWVAVHVEQALYEAPGSNHFFVRFRVTNLTQRPLALDLQDKQGTWSLFYPYQWTLAEGDHRGMGNGLQLVPLFDAMKPKETRLLANYKAGKLTVIPPSGTVDYYRASISGGRDNINQGWASAPLWVRSKSFIPRAPFPPHFIMSVRGAMPLTDGQKAKSFVKIGTDIAMPFPLRWKQMPSHA